MVLANKMHVQCTLPCQSHIHTNSSVLRIWCCKAKKPHNSWNSTALRKACPSQLREAAQHTQKGRCVEKGCTANQPKQVKPDSAVTFHTLHLIYQCVQTESSLNNFEHLFPLSMLELTNRTVPEVHPSGMGLNRTETARGKCGVCWTSTVRSSKTLLE